MAVQVETQGQLQELLRLLKKRKWQILLPALIVASIGVFVAVVIPKKFVVSTEIELRAVVISGAVKGDEYVSAIIEDAPMAPYQLRAITRVQDVVRSLGWPDYLALERDPERAAEMGEFLERVQRNISVSVPAMRVESTRFLTISYSDRDADRAEQFLIALRDNWIDDVLRRDENRLRIERDRLKEERKSLERQLEDERQARSQVLKTHRLSPSQPLDAQRAKADDPLYIQLTENERDLEESQLRLVEIAGLVAELEAQRDDLEAEIVTTFNEDAVDYQPQILGALIEIEDLEARKDRYRPQHPGWQKIQDEIDDLKERVATWRSLESEGELVERRRPNPARGAIQDSIDRLLAERQGLESKTRRLAEEIAADRQKLDELVDVYRQIATHDSRIENLFQGLTLTNALFVEKENQYGIVQVGGFNPFTITKHPIKPTEPTEPNPALIITMATVFGLGLGLVLALIAEFSRSCFRSANDIARVLPLPILGSIQRITTRAERRRRLLTRMLLGFSGLVLSGSFLFLAYAWMYNSELLNEGVKSAIHKLGSSLW